MHKMILKISMASKMAAKLNNYIDDGAKEVSFFVILIIHV